MGSSARGPSRVAWLAVSAVCAATWCSAARAQDKGAEARVRFERGYALAQSGAFEQSIQEFELAYAASPNFSVLFNLAQAYGALGRVVKAKQTLQRYLDLGGDAIDAEQRRRTGELIAYYLGRIGRIAVTGLPSGAELSLDAEELGAVPVEAPQDAAAGRHVLSVRAQGYDPLVQVVEVRAGELATVELALSPRPQNAVAGMCPKIAVASCLAPLAQARYGRSKTQRAVAMAVGGGAVLLGGAAITLAIVNHSRYVEWRKRDEAFTTAFERDPSSTSIAQLESLLSDENAIRNRDSLELGLGVAAGTLALTSLALYLTAGHGAPTVSVGPRGDTQLGYRVAF
ncbi:MAG: PEGA domain-containing protein [Polyangiaceae bacterium]